MIQGNRAKTVRLHRRTYIATYIHSHIHIDILPYRYRLVGSGALRAHFFQKPKSLTWMLLHAFESVCPTTKNWYVNEFTKKNLKRCKIKSWKEPNPSVVLCTCTSTVHKYTIYILHKYRLQYLHKSISIKKDVCGYVHCMYVRRCNRTVFALLPWIIYR